ncbi:MAG TPA: alkaline phosphatase D family protein [Roseateles sp.]|nr:alkaline phosphatase D family protein [Roseateles sp.]
MTPPVMPELCSVFPPLHRVERARAVCPETGTDQVRVLTALRPEQGWPRLWAWLPVREDGAALRPLAEDQPLEGQVLLQPFEHAAFGAPGDALRGTVPAERFPPERDAQGRRCGLLCLFVYADLRGQQREGEPGEAGLEAALRAALAMGWLALRHALTPLPPEDETMPGADGGLSLVLAACQYPPQMLDMSLGAEADPAKAGPGQAALARLVALTRGTAAGRQVSLLLLAGDQIYADSTGGLADGRNSVDRYARPYQQFKAGLPRHLPPSLARIVHAPDDHEIEDNWEPVADPAAPGGQRRGPLADAALAAAWAARWEAGEREGVLEHFWHRFDWRGAAFFVGDARTEREPRHAARLAEAQMLSAAQRQGFEQWLADDKAGRPRFVLTGSLLLPRRRATREHPASALRSDAWDGYPASLHWLLGALWARRADQVVFLSGDEHRSGYVSAEIRREGDADGEGGDVVRLLSIHSSGLYTPWPFAVTRPADLAAPDSFSFPGPQGQVLRCTVSAWTDFPGDGFALLRADRGGRLRLWFDRAGRALHEAGGEIGVDDAGWPAPDGEFWLGRA